MLATEEKGAGAGAGAAAPPSFDETLADVSLFMLFLRYAALSRQAEGVLFVKQATLFAHMRRPRREVLEEAARIHWTYVARGAHAEVPALSADVRARAEAAVWAAHSDTAPAPDMFADGVGEARRALAPTFAEWLATEEWTTCHFARLPPPSLEAALLHDTLRASLFALVRSGGSSSSSRDSSGTETDKAKAAAGQEGEEEEEKEKDNHGDDGKDRGQLERELLFCFDVLRAAQTAGTAVTTLPAATAAQVAARHTGLLTATVGESAEGEPPTEYVARAYGDAATRAAASDAFRAWLAQGAWRETDYHPLMRCQSYDAHGFMQVPTLVAALSSPALLRLLCYFLKRNHARALAVAFLLDAIRFTRQYGATGTSSSTSTGTGSESPSPLMKPVVITDEPPTGQECTGASASNYLPAAARNTAGESNEPPKKRAHASAEMVAEARRVYARYLKGDSAALVGVPPALKAEVKAALGGFGARSRVTGGVFRRCGAYVHHRISHTWFREVVGSFVWVDMDYNNDVPAARFVADEFGAAQLADLDLAVPPSIDDVIYNDALVRSFVATLTPVLAAEVSPFVAAADAFMRGTHRPRSHAGATTASGAGAAGAAGGGDKTDKKKKKEEDEEDENDDEDSDEGDGGSAGSDGEEEESDGGEGGDKDGHKRTKGDADAATTTARFRRALELLSPMILLFPQTKGFYRTAQMRLEAAGGCAQVRRTVFQYARNAVLSELLRKHHAAWAADDAHWRRLPWTPRAVCCYDPSAGLYAFAAYTSARAAQGDQLFFYDSVVSKSVVLAPHRTPPSASLSPASASSSASASRASSPTAPAAQPKPLHALGKSRSFHHTFRSMLLRRPSAADVVQPTPRTQQQQQQQPFATHRQCSSSSSSSSIQDTTGRGATLTPAPTHAHAHAHHASVGQSPLQGCAVSGAGTASARRTARHSLGPVGPVGPGAPLIAADDAAGDAGGDAGGDAAARTYTPTLAQVLGSAFLRQAFEDTVLLDRLAASADLRLWTRLDSFFWRHHGCSDSELCRRRADLVATAAAILDDHAERAAALLAAAHAADTVPALRAYLATPGALVTAAFFRPLEVALCEPHFAHFRAQLQVHVRP